MSKFLFLDDKIINILRLTDQPSGGAAVQTYGWVRGLSEIDQDVVVLTNLKANETLKEECKNIKLIPLYNKNKGMRWLRWVYYRLPYLYSEIKKTKPDFLYQSVPGWQSFIIGIICRVLHVKYLLRISNDFLVDKRFYRKSSRVHNFLMNLGFMSTHSILCQNEYQYSIIKKRFPNKKVIKITNPVVLKSNTCNSIKNSNGYIAWIGLFQYQKNLKLLHEIATKFTNEKFRIAGSPEPSCDKETLSYIDKLKQLPNVRFVGFLQRGEVLPFLFNAKFLLNTSHYEGFSNTFLEAMIARTPILTSINVNPDSIISKYNLGLVYRDCDDLYTQYLKITTEAYEQMTKNVMNYVFEHHDHKHLSKRLLESLAN
jgi:glycosyltransferase involved in cell wall biosynthesis